MQTFDYCLACGPLAVYLILIGLANLRRRPLVVSGSRELAALGVAVVGFLAVGPMQLFVPTATAQRFGWLVWPLLLSFYGLSLTLWMLVARPRLVVYNINVNELRPALAELVLTLDSDARWAGDSVALPHLGVQLRIENLPMLRNVVLVANGDTQSFTGWRRLERELRLALARIELKPNARGALLCGIGAILLSTMFYQAVKNPQEVAQGFFQILSQ